MKKSYKSMIKAHFTGERIYSTSEDAFSLFEKSALGEKKENKVEYSLAEALYLLKDKKIEILFNNKPLSHENLMKKLRKIDKRIETKLIVFTDLRTRGYIVKTALKFGADFRVYNKGVKPGADHAKWILFVANESESLTWQDFAGKNRVAHSTKKNLLLAIVDEEAEVSYYEISWIRP